jgi:hypothetical protein
MATAQDVETGPDGAPTLKRVMGPGLLLLFVVGDILGTGVYALTGKVAPRSAVRSGCRSWSPSSSRS